MPSFWRRCCQCFGCAPEEEEEERQRQPPSAADGSHTPNSDVLIDVREGGEATAVEMQAMLHSRAGSGRGCSPITGPPQAAPPLPPGQLRRAIELSRWTSEDLGWCVLPDPDPSAPKAHFYFNTWTGRTVWSPPARIAALRTLANQTSDLAIPGHLDFAQGMVERMADLGIEVLLWQDVLRDRAELLHVHDIRGRAPCLLHLLFYAHVLVNELSIYPPSFLRSAGLRHIILVDDLSYGKQRRAAVPLVETGVLLLDPKLEEIVYVTNVLHHELFHAVDCNMIWRTENHERKRRQRERATAPDEDDDSMCFDFVTAQNPTEAAEPLAPYCLDEAANLHGVPDRAWSSLNPPGFKYGQGGAAERGHEMFLSHGTVGSAGTGGFLNPYSRTAVEEDKAEVYAAMVRDASALLRTDADPVLGAKGRELMRRLEWFCSEMGPAFWTSIRGHSPHPLRPKRTDQWVEKTDHLGHRYFFNQTTKQTSWVTPTQA